MDVHADRRVATDRRAVGEADRRGRDRSPSPDDYINAAQFMLGTRQREEAVLRATHLHREAPDVQQDRARETLAEMIHLQESITAREAQSTPRRGGRDRHRVIDVEPASTPTDVDTRSGGSRTGLLAGLVMVSLLIVAVLAGLQLGLI